MRLDFVDNVDCFDGMSDTKSSQAIFSQVWLGWLSHDR